MLEITSKSSPVGSTIFALCALFVISLVVLGILRHYLPLRSTPAFYLLPIFFALWLPSVVVVLVPIDLASSAITDDDASRGIWLPERAILVSWRITYWLTFVLTWFLLPILAEYSDSGYREPSAKLAYSLRSNAQFMGMVLLASLLGLIYVVISYGFNFASLKGLVMALGYVYGLVLAIYLMGHGLVSIPRRLIRNASITGRLRRLQTKAPRLYERMQDSLVNLEELEYQVSELSRRKVGSAADFRDWIEELQELADVGEHHAPPTTIDPTANRIIPTVITEKYLADLTRNLMRARHTRSRYVSQWNHMIQEAAETQAIIDSAASKKLDFGDADPHAGLWERTRVLTPYARHMLHFQVLPYAQVLLGLFLAASSACIVWSEVIKVAFPRLSVIRFTVVHHWSKDKAEVGFAGQCIASFWICYMCAAALITMTEVKTWRGRALVKRNTAYESAFWYALQVAKLTVPISYNFMTFLVRRVYTKTVFYKFFGESIDLTPLGRWFDDLLPVFVLLPVVATLFGVYGKIKRIFVGLDVVEDEEENPSAFGTGTWREGRDLIERELRGNTTGRRQDAFARLASATGNPSHSAPVLSIPSARRQGTSPARSPVRPALASNSNNGRAGQSSRTSRLEEPEDDNIFAIIGHRMKNTIDTIDTPRWMQDFKKPKWMGGDDDAESGPQPQERPGGGERNNSDIRRWFGGDSGIRL
ncbi:LIMR family protein-like protein [Emericellopsis cladophorae]|uniref:LIMR family protein-like protein n=1 Tax=Emericellopsis cladophorae TaxID=2686198 RepID=A0A9P9Y026_9HYPO|nr:LIMR family protein-like protein [Emericellopsis cladophorae]KAI6781074.1 LIMR family protein-like protein [Emericellopsis cladophorae]